MIKRVFDLIFSTFGLIILFPFLFLIAILIKTDSSGDIFYLQERVGLRKKMFKLFKFRTMKPYSDGKGLLTVGMRDPRVTKIGYYLRKYKIDELPQLINVFKGDMSFVGPRPEVKRYVDYYTQEQLRVLSVKPGITDKASILYRNENELLSMSNNPEQFYLDEIMPIKLKINLEYIESNSFWKDIIIIMQTLKSIFNR